MFYILGLGNPEEKYDGTRHNVGRDMVRQLAGGEWEKSKPANALYQRESVAGTNVEWVLPETYMNKSGDTVRYIATKHAACPEDFIVIYDDVDLAFGEVKVSFARGSGGHNGLKSIEQALKSKDYIRIRIGISPKSFWTGKVKRPSGAAMGKYVLARFSSSEKKQLPELAATVREILAVIAQSGVEKAMNQFN